MIIKLLLFVTGLILIINPTFGQLPSEFAKFKVLDGLNPITIVGSPDGRIFVVEKDGRILAVENDKVLPGVFFSKPVSDRGERGLLGMALHPNFLSNGFFYLFYSVSGRSASRLSRFTAGDDIDLSEEILFEVTGVTTSHLGGSIKFGNDGKLFVAIGDNYTPENAQSLDNIFGKLLRFNDDGSIPTDNPFYLETSGLNRSIWAIGFRNPFTFNVNNENGLLFANDVGNAKWEEINLVEKGKNYGWPVFEGQAIGEVELQNYRDPLYTYSHDVGCSIVGGDFYPDSGNFPSRYFGKYFFVDYCGGFIQVLNPNDGVIEETFESAITRPLSVFFTDEGDLYYLERGEGAGDGSGEDVRSSLDGSLWKVIYNPEGRIIISEQPKNLLVSIGEGGSLNVTAMGLSPISYQWTKNGEVLDMQTSNFLLLENLQLLDSGSTYQCKITNLVGTILSDSVTVHVTTNKRPKVQINTPGLKESYAGGETIILSGQASDPEDGMLDASRMNWWVDFHHKSHTHPAMEVKSGNNISFTFTKKGETSDEVWYRIFMSVYDSNGLSSFDYVDVQPRLRQITIDSSPPGLKMLLEDELITTPRKINSVEGLIRTLTVPAEQILNDDTYYFIDWDGGDESRQIKFSTPKSDSTITVNYSKNGFYPNPVHDYLYIEYNVENDFKVGIMILTLKGEVLLTSELHYSSTEYVHAIALQGLAMGTYILVLNTGYGEERHFIVKD